MKALTTNQIGLIRDALELSTRMGGTTSEIAEYENLIEIMKTGCGITVGRDAVSPVNNHQWAPEAEETTFNDIPEVFLTTTEA